MKCILANLVLLIFYTIIRSAVWWRQN